MQILRMVLFIAHKVGDTMSKVSITRSKLDTLAVSISTKSGATLPLTLTEMKDAVDGIQTGGGGSVTQDQDGYIVLPSTGGGGSPSATQHTIYFEFTDSTDATINAWYDSSFISDAIRATEPTTYGQKTVSLAQLDGVTWYEPQNIPLNTELIDFTKVTNDTAINSNGVASSEQWYSASDYTVIAPDMTFSYKGCRWWYLAFYDSSKAFISSIYIDNDTTVDPNDSNIGDGTLSGNEIPSNASYIRITSTNNPDSTILSLIRTA